MNIRRFAVAFFALAGPQLAGPLSGKAADTDYQRDVLPILSRRCYECHAEKRKGGLRLDRRADALRGGDAGPVILPGKSRESRLIRFVSGENPDEVMPPRGERLTAVEVEVLRSWIDGGAAWPDALAGNSPVHWAYVAPVQSPVPPHKGAAAARNPLDDFILGKLEVAGLDPSPEAERATLLRRVSLDLTGLPPSVPEVDAFEKDERPDAYEANVDRLLHSPAYGERWARLWLDLARYADTQGYEKDNRRTIWRYRDWVIDAFNQNLPFDEFTVEQIAGDLLPGATLDQRIATAFHRNTMTNTEGGTDNEEFRTNAVVDRINTTFAVWLGTTMNCSQCHTHKYDPFPQKEYYQVLAFLNSTTDADNDDEAPYIEAPTPLEAEAAAKLRDAIARVEKVLDTPTPELAVAQEVWERRMRSAPQWTPLRPTSVAATGASHTVLDDASILAAGERPETTVTTVECDADLDGVTAFRLEALTDPSLPHEGPGRADDGNFVLSTFSVEASSAGAASGDGTPRTPVPLGAAAADFSQDGFPVANALAQKDPKDSGWAVQPHAGKEHWAVFAVKQPVAVGMRRVTFTLAQSYRRPGFLLGRFRLSATRDPHALEHAAAPAEILRIVERESKDRNAEERDALARHFRSIAPELTPAREELARLRAELPRPATVPVLVELPQPRATHIMIRGNFLNLGDLVEPQTPAVLHPLPPSEPKSRLTFARWLVDKRNPLTARVLVNRIWEQFFGVGIVKTLEDFGTQGERPSNPELLDWLACELERLDWDLKAFQRLVVTSRTYRQSSRVNARLLEADPENRLLARGPRVRLAAETIRDSALAASGLLSHKLHGPSVMPPQPDGLWQVVYNGDRWVTSPGEDKYRRGLYTFWRRTMPHPAMVAFDAPSREFCALKRSRTNTPLQALTTLNDPALVEAAQAIARRVMAEVPDGSVEARAARAFRLCLSRRPLDAEIARLSALFREESARYRQTPQAAETLATTGLGPAPACMDIAELAGWTVVANVILNLDETITKG